MNKCILVGNLTKDPELTTTSNGVAMCRFSIAVSRRFANSDGERETDFFNIVVWRILGENCHKFLKKGSKVGIVGNLQSRSYDAADGTKRYVTDIVAEEVEFLSTKQSDDQPKSSSGDEVAKLQPIDDDGLPF
ncbi:MAG: single-stranded DNA-binding protein [Clostridiales bacterium]|nr:single-stranded DNA-binding protein [Clostridiales bacterium]